MWPHLKGENDGRVHVEVDGRDVRTLAVGQRHDGKHLLAEGFLKRNLAPLRRQHWETATARTSATKYKNNHGYKSRPLT